MFFEPPVLAGDVVRLEPLTEAAFDELTRAALAAPSLWTHIALPMRNPAEVAQTLAGALAEQRAGGRLGFVARLALARGPGVPA